MNLTITLLKVPLLPFTRPSLVDSSSRLNSHAFYIAPYTSLVGGLIFFRNNAMLYFTIT